MTTLAILSDIHGCLTSLNTALEHAERFSPDYYLVLGDVLNHGPRNPVPTGYAPALVAEKLNSFKEKIIAVRGNCDSEVDQMLLEFLVLAPHNQMIFDNRRWFVTHGHLYKPEELPLSERDVLLSGHTHIAGIQCHTSGFYMINPGSVTFPRNGAEPSYAIYQDGVLSIIGLSTEQVLFEQSMVG